jgi:competence protein ComFC
MNFLLNLIFPKNCYGCYKNGLYICDDCIKNKLFINIAQLCHVCGKESRIGMAHKDCSEQSYLDGLIFITLYEGSVERMIWDVKYKFCFAVLEDISRIMYKYFRFYKFRSDMVFTSVPLHPKKKRIRGFNQAEILARYICKSSRVEYLELLKRVNFTHTQVGLGKESREVNLKNVFEATIEGEGLKMRDVLIIDDVYTTGSTLNECAKVLKLAGFNKVYGFVFAKAGLK